MMENERKQLHTEWNRARSVRELAEFLGVSERHLWNLIKRKELAHTRIGSRIVLLPTQISDFLCRHSVDAMQASR